MIKETIKRIIKENIMENSIPKLSFKREAAATGPYRSFADVPDVQIKKIKIGQQLRDNG